MPVLDWICKNLDYEIKDGSRTQRFDVTASTVFELFLLKSPSAEENYTRNNSMGLIKCSKK
jgi:D-mannonate dehydratase